MDDEYRAEALSGDYGEVPQFSLDLTLGPLSRWARVARWWGDLGLWPAAVFLFIAAGLVLLGLVWIQVWFAGVLLGWVLGLRAGHERGVHKGLEVGRKITQDILDRVNRELRN